MHLKKCFIKRRISNFSLYLKIALVTLKPSANDKISDLNIQRN